MEPGKHHRSKQRGQDLCWKVHTLHNLLFRAHLLCMSYVTNMFLLVSFLFWRKQLLCFVQGQGQKSEQKHTTKSLDEFHNNPPLLTIFRPVHIRCYKITDRHEILHGLSLVDRCL